MDRMDRTLVIAPHADDETLGCGMILQILNPVVVLVTSPQQPEFSEAFIASRKIQIERIRKEYGTVIELNLPSTRVELLMTIKSLIPLLTNKSYDSLLIPSSGDLHSDHKIVNEACMNISKISRCCHIKTIMEYETLTESFRFIPDTYYCSKESEIQKKIDRMSVYSSENVYPKNYRGIRELARFRGMECGCEFAEAFNIIRRIM